VGAALLVLEQEDAELYDRVQERNLMRIRENRAGYESALVAADAAWEEGHLDFTEMEAYLAALVEQQLRDA